MNKAQIINLIMSGMLFYSIVLSADEQPMRTSVLGILLSALCLWGAL